MTRYDFSTKRLFVAADLLTGSTVALDRMQANYLCNVLRLADGAELLVFNGRNGEWRARLDGAGRRAELQIGQQTRTQPAAPDLDYLFAPLKQARLDYVVEKAVEMGVGRLRPVLTQHGQVMRLNLDRMRANVVEAAEQCGILSLPAVDEPARLTDLLARWPAGRPLVFCDEDAPIADPLAALRAAGMPHGASLLVGPEGGFSAAERHDLLASPDTVRISLGPRILRADTAAVAALALLQATIGDWTERTP